MHLLYLKKSKKKQNKTFDSRGYLRLLDVYIELVQLNIYS